MKLTTDVVLFRWRKRKGVEVLFLKRNRPPYQFRWCLPSSLIQEAETLEHCARNAVKESTGLRPGNLEQFHCFGNVQRDPRYRSVSVGYFALIRMAKTEFEANELPEQQWHQVTNLPDLAFDHTDIVNTAFSFMQQKMLIDPIIFDLLPHQFAFSDLEHCVVDIFSITIDRRNFRKRLLHSGFVVETEKTKASARGRRSTLYEFNRAQSFENKFVLHRYL